MKSRLQLLVVLLFIGTVGIIFILSGKNSKDTENAVSLEVVEEIKENTNSELASKQAVKETEDLQNNENKSVNQNKEETNYVEKSDKPKKIFVHVCGAVKKEGVYELEEEARVVDAIKAAGGLKEKAASYGINQAEALKDGMQVYVPTKKEASKPQTSGFRNTTQPERDSNNSQNTAININTATKEELMKLNGVGEAKAMLIINYREANGGFKNITDIMKIKGIKQKFFDKIKDNICV